MPALNVAGSPREGVFKVKVHSQDNSFLGETEIRYLDIVEEVLTQAIENPEIMKKFLKAAIPCLQANSDSTQDSSNVGMSTFSIAYLYDIHDHIALYLTYTRAHLFPNFINCYFTYCQNFDRQIFPPESDD